MADDARAASLPADGAVRRLPPALRLSLRIRKKTETTLGSIAGLSLDQPINRFSASGGRLAARLGPNEWRVIGDPAETESIAFDIADKLADRFHAVVDVSQSSVAFAVEGPDAENILNTGCPLDLAVRSFPVGSATRTVLGKCEIILFRFGDTSFHVECWRSFGDYVQAFFQDAAALNATTSSR